MTNYRNGIAYERRIMRELSAQGALAVFRSAGSHGPVDVIAVFDHGVYGIQVKTVRGKGQSVSKEDIDKVNVFAALMKDSMRVRLYAYMIKGNTSTQYIYDPGEQRWFLNATSGVRLISQPPKND